MNGKFPLAALRVTSGQARFLHFLSPTSLGDYRRTNHRRSRNDRSSAGRRVPQLFDSLGLSNLCRRQFLSMFVVTEFTQSGTFARSAAYSQGSQCAIELPLSAFRGREIYVFNGDVQNLAAAKVRKPEWVRFEGDVEALLSTISEWRNRLPDKRDHCSFVCEARLIQPLSPALGPIFHNCPESMSAEHIDPGGMAVEDLLGEED